MTDRAVQAVLFDIGNVFVHWDPRYLYEQLIADADELDFFLREVVTLEWHSRHDRGVPFQQNADALTARFPEYEDLIRLFDTRWDETILKPVAGVARLLELLVDNDVRCVALTNFPAEKWPAFRLNYPFTDLFHGVVVSGQERMIKPDPRIFQLASKRYHLDPEATLFVDDRQPNIDAAQQLGFHVHRFEDAKGLEACLDRHGLMDETHSLSQFQASTDSS